MSGSIARVLTIYWDDRLADVIFGLLHRCVRKNAEHLALGFFIGLHRGPRSGMEGSSARVHAAGSSVPWLSRQEQRFPKPKIDPAIALRNRASRQT